MTKKKQTTQGKRVQDDESVLFLNAIVATTPGATHYVIEGDTVYICSQNGFRLKALKV